MLKDMDIDSPAFSSINSILESDNEEAPSAKKPRLESEVRFSKTEKGKYSSSQKIKKKSKVTKVSQEDDEENESHKRSDALLTEITSNILQNKKENNVEDEVFKEEPDVDKENEVMDDKHAVKSEVSEKNIKMSNSRLSRFLRMNEGNNIDDEDFEHDVDEENEEVNYALIVENKKFVNDDDFAVAGPSGINQKSSVGCDDDSDSDEDDNPLEAVSRETEKSSSDDSSDSDGDHPLAIMRREAKKRIKKAMKKFRNPDLEKKLFKFQPKGKISTFKSPPKGRRKRGQEDPAFRFGGMIPTEKRRSSRLRKKNPEYTYEILDDIHETQRRAYFKRPDFKLDDYSLEDLEKVLSKPKRKSTGKKKTEEHVIIPVEEVTQEMLDNIALRVKGKIYSANGTTCHQCRQKTMDQKTCCRNPECYGIFGMFCGVCIKNRYGEDAAEVLLNPNWICPVCRGKCNCSICRTKQGKRPTGVLAPLALQSGFESVDHFLDNLRGEGDRPEEDRKYKLQRDPEALLGFYDDGRQAKFGDGSSDFLYCNLCAFKQYDHSDNLLGFSKDGSVAVMGGHKLEPLFGL